MSSMNGLTVYEKPIVIYSIEYYSRKLTARAVPSINSQAYMSNVLICEETADTENSFILSSDDCMELCDILMGMKSHKVPTNHSLFSTTLATNVKATYSIIYDLDPENEYNDIDEEHVVLHITDTINNSQATYDIAIPIRMLKEVCDNIMKAVNQGLDMLECNRNLEKMMTTLKNDMKLEKVHELYFEIYDPEPKMYKTSILDDGKNWIKTYKITARDKNSNPLYSFLRNMHLTCVPMVDYRDYGKEFLCCPFVFSDEMIEIGKQFVKDKEKDAHETVNNKIEGSK